MLMQSSARSDERRVRPKRNWSGPFSYSLSHLQKKWSGSVCDWLLSRSAVVGMLFFIYAWLVVDASTSRRQKAENGEEGE